MQLPACPECNGKLVVEVNETVCQSCGAVAAIDQGAWQDVSHRGPKWLGTTLLDRDSDRLGTPRMKYLAKRVNYNRAYVYVASCQSIIERACNMAGIPANIKAIAMGIAERVAPIRPATMPIVAAYCLVYADRMTSVGSFSSKKLMKAIGDMGYRIKWHSVLQLDKVFPVPPKVVNIDAMMWSTISGLRSTRDLSTHYWSDLASDSKHILGLIENYRDGTDPSTIAGLCVYLAEVAIATREKRKRYFTQKDVARFTRVSAYALRDLLERIRSERRSGLGRAVRTDDTIPERMETIKAMGGAPE